MEAIDREPGDRAHRGLELGAVIANLPELLLARAADRDRWAVIVELGSNRFAQALVTEEGAFVVECVSNRFLAPADQLSDADEHALIAAGFEAPWADGEPHPNFFANLEGHGAALEAARMMEAALLRALGGRPRHACELVIRPLASAP